MTSFHEGPHAAQFILTEANGQRSRDNVTVAEGQEFLPGTVLVVAAGGEASAWASGPGNLAIAIYGAKREAGGDPVSISVIARDAEVNRHAMAWPDGADETLIGAASTELAKQGIIVRGHELPSP